MGGGGWQQQMRQPSPQDPTQQQAPLRPPNPSPSQQSRSPVGTPHHQMKSPSQPNYGRTNFDINGKFFEKFNL